ncbi:TonB-dependent receptor [Cellvibrio japonicus]|uniref:TonB-dependent receptor n=1 Tax=Cellvibrio japonicus (strain Ueda107) TaxID=498211 RepID=B3PGG0_CELJU|nr:TonB-dependent receptor [Cellvibrio japonicus]ACE85721.1 TonB-dependent receptor [Cellvibrio japonicus Ueda107]QEI10950.1 TonB-dependent receptor [Cellvibrio japonicus]QEI14526.1 TonB-dependent receptor [Cellvibrio japonicus]QEI18104.1 TonB-dependent receptor [Cellvibrio japonicus]
MNQTQNNNQVGFKKTLLATAVASYAVLGFAAPAMAQQQEVVEEVIVTGIKASLQRSMDVKRDAKGVVDAISAEDIGKFPDTNLAESLQRISGVSIDRQNNEGSKITVRGFGPDFNLVTLNGRQMPTNGSSRSFEFSDLASESVSGVEVYKTFGATRASGGIGALVNIKTARPLDNPGFKASLGAKAVMDSTNEVGDDVTPEISGIFSNTFADDTIGIAISGSYQERDNRAVNADIANWRNNIDFETAVADAGASVNVTDNRSDPNGNVYYPRNFGYGIEDFHRERTNAQAVLQYTPTETIKATLDYTYAKVDLTAQNTGVGIWYNDSGSDAREVVIDENGTITKLTACCDDYASNIRLNTSETESKSVGFNLEWQANDNLTLAFDAHNSVNENGGVGRGHNAFLILAAPFIETKTYDATAGKDIPFMHITFNPSGTGIVDGMPTAASYDSLFGEANLNLNKSEVTQFQLSGSFETDADSGITSVNFGLGNADIVNRWRTFSTGQIAAGWYGGNQDLFPDEIFTEHKLNGLMPSFSGGGSNVPVYHAWDFEKAVAIAEAEWAIPGGSTRPWGWGTGVMRPDLNGNPISDHKVTEETTNAYLEFNSRGDLAGMPLNITTGMRYETTDIEANSFQQDPAELVWINQTEWSLNLAQESSYTSVGGSYDVWLPSLDLSLEVTEDVVARLSYSKSITRPTLNKMIGTTSVTSRPKPGERTGTAGNPDLKPFMADNFDLSAEWYYDDASYVSAGFFLKQVDDFIVDVISKRTVGNLRDPSKGPRAQQAIADLEALGINPTDANVIAQIKANEGLSTSDNIVQNDDDPLAEFDMTQPANQEQAKFYGWEFAVQHMLGETGFGVQANATFVTSDIDVDNSSTDFQFALPGLSDSANLVVFYDKDGLQARVAYNWRDTFLNGFGEGNTPYYTEEYGQVDISLSYDLPWVDGMTVFVEGININDASQRVYARYENQFKSAYQYGARYNLGVRYNF